MDTLDIIVLFCKLVISWLSAFGGLMFIIYAIKIWSENKYEDSVDVAYKTAVIGIACMVINIAINLAGK